MTIRQAKQAGKRRSRLVRQAKQAGMSREKVEKIIITNLRAAAQRDGWRPSERAAAEASWVMVLEEVYGPKTQDA